nr:hypothetical protein [Tanacetum cinerariifolium]
MAKKDLINKSGVARSFPGSFPQRGLNAPGLLVYAGVSGRSLWEVVEVVESSWERGKWW